MSIPIYNTHLDVVRTQVSVIRTLTSLHFEGEKCVFYSENYDSQLQGQLFFTHQDVLESLRFDAWMPQVQ